MQNVALDTNASESSPRLSIGFSSGASYTLANDPIAGIPSIPSFPTPLGEYRSSFIPEFGIEAAYRVHAQWELGVRARYYRAELEASGNERVLLSVWNPAQNRFVPQVGTLRNTLQAQASVVSATPLVRWFWGTIFMSAGLQVELPVASSLRYTTRIVAPDNVTFVSNGSQIIDVSLNPEARVYTIALSPTMSFGVAVNLERFRLIPEVQIQPLSYLLQARTPNETALSMPSVRLNLGLLLNVSSSKSVPNSASDSSAVSDSARNMHVSAVVQSIPVVDGERHRSPREQLSSLRPENFPVVPVLAVRTDTVFQRDTVIRVVEWSKADTVRIERSTIERRTVGSTEQVIVSESYVHDVPRPKPLLLGNLDIRFIPVAGAPKYAERRKIARLVEERMIVSSFLLSTELTGMWDTVHDTIMSVRLPWIRFTPSVSSEAGVQTQKIVIACEKNATLAVLYEIGTRFLDLDAQILVFPHILPHFRERLKGCCAVCCNNTRNVRAWLHLSDVQGQQAYTDTVQVIVESAEHTLSQRVVLTTQTNSMLKTVTRRWVLVHIPLVRTASDKHTYSFNVQAIPMLRQMRNGRQLVTAQKQRTKKRCIVYAVIPERLSDDAVLLEREMRNIRKLLHTVGKELGTSVELVVMHMHDASATTEEVYVQALIDEAPY
ncbi:MAG: hypothetical protein RML40_08395 [Bacteroidota bacterium]|nr:hypothetical protein [Candidatus Kapabacteria bacterium]MDW8220535.1 hypothetical protein [Bacteroidota bacterium]